MDVLATTVTPGHGHAQLLAEPSAEGIQLGTRGRAEAPGRIVDVNQVELDWQAAGQVRQPLGVALANIHPGYHGPCQRDPLPADGVILSERLNEVRRWIALFDGQQFPPLEWVRGSQRDDQAGAMRFVRNAADAGDDAD